MLTELKLLRSEVGLKLDGINNRLGEVTKAITALEGKVAEINRTCPTVTRTLKQLRSWFSGAEKEFEKVQIDWPELMY